MQPNATLAMSFLMQFAANGDDAIRLSMLGAFSREAYGGLKQRSNIVELYDELRPSLYGYLISLGLSTQETDDVIQETFLSLFEQMESGVAIDNARGWVFRVAHNSSRTRQKRELRLVSATPVEGGPSLFERPDTALSPEDAYLWREYLDRLHAALDRLPEQQRQCLHLRAEGLRYREIANVLGVSTSRIPQLLERAIVRIMDELQGDQQHG
jgi:RNA polymerase sigma-70 factor (ECF subfamily)